MQESTENKRQYLAVYGLTPEQFTEGRRAAKLESRSFASFARHAIITKTKEVLQNEQ